MDEVWIQIDDHPDYAVSNHGRVKRIKTGPGTYAGKIKKQGTNTHGYQTVSLSLGTKAKNIVVHTLVCTAFHGPPPPGKHTNHKDGLKTNNNSSNLEWITPKENTQHAIQNQLWSAVGEHNNSSKLTANQVQEIRQFLQNRVTQETIAKHFGVCQQTISRIKCNIAWNHI